MKKKGGGQNSNCIVLLGWDVIIDVGPQASTCDDQFILNLFSFFEYRVVCSGVWGYKLSFDSI